jgi:hypothetical protein
VEEGGVPGATTIASYYVSFYDKLLFELGAKGQLLVCER